MNYLNMFYHYMTVNAIGKMQFEISECTDKIQSRLNSLERTTISFPDSLYS